MAKILLAEDDLNLAKILSFHLSEAGHSVTTARDGEEALRFLRETGYDVLLTDVKMPRMDGMELIRMARQDYRYMPVIAMTAYGTINDAVVAMKEGATDYLTKPVSRETLLMAMDKALSLRTLTLENLNLKESLRDRSALSKILGKSPSLLSFLEAVKRVAKTEASVLLLGESGTGKELAAAAIHEISPRFAGPFVPLNCAAIPHDLLESELFGYEKGAFTGAVQSRQGKVEQADRGTLFLDEIGDMDMALQAKILRLLETKTVEPLGSREGRKVDFRLVAATHRDLHEMVEEGKFRNDLYFRLTVVPLSLPPLRERKEDIPLLLRHFFKSHDGEELSISPSALQRLTDYNWPGNIRELENLAQRWAILHKGERITPEHLPKEILTGTAPGAEDKGSLWEIEKKAIEDALATAEGNISKASRELGIPRHILIYRMKKWKI